MLGTFEPESWFKAMRSQNTENLLVNLSEKRRSWLAARLYDVSYIDLLSQSDLTGPATRIWNLTKRMKHLATALREARDLALLQTIDPDHLAFEDLLEAKVALYESPDNGLAKAGHDVRTYSNLLLDTAREFVRMCLGSYADGDMQELFTQINPLEVLEADALRKRVERFRNSYPQKHAVALKWAAAGAAAMAEDVTTTDVSS